MKENKKEIFIEYMNEFSKLNENQKNNEIIEKQKFMLNYLIQYAKEHNIDYEFLSGKELNNNSLDEIMIYTENIEEIIGLILNSL